VPSPPPPLRRLVIFVLVALAYAATAWASQAFLLANTNVSLVWLPAGVAVAALMAWGAWLWPVVPVTQFLWTYLVEDQGAFNTLRVTLATTLAALVTYRLLRQRRCDPALMGLRDAVWLAIATMTGGAAGAIVNGVLRAFERGGWSGDAPARLLSWWLGDVTGVLLLVPLACTWPYRPAADARVWRSEDTVVVALLAIVAGLAPVAFPAGATALLGLLYVALGVQMWAAARWGPRGGAQAFAVTACAVLLASLATPDEGLTREPISLALLDGFLIVSAMSTLFVASLVAEHTRAITALAESRRLETVRRLAGGVAHDFNNLLTVIMSHVGLMRAGKAEAGDLDGIQRAAGQAATLSRQLLAYGQEMLLRPAVFDVNDVVRELVAALREAAPPGVTVQTTLGDALPPVRNDRDQLTRVLEQLGQRAVRVLGGAGTVTVATAPGGPDGMAGVTLRITDTGPPLPPDVQARPFEPYVGAFVTGDRALQPSGLELAMAHGFAQQVGGRITLDSAPGRGTTVALELPAAPAGAGAER
jgi:signal transduction histidine kinase